MGEQPPREGPGDRRTGRAATAGLVAAVAALGVGELVAGGRADFASPVESVAQEVIDRAPRPVQTFAIDTFGHDDKLVLVIGTVVLALGFGAALGLVGRRRLRPAAAGFAAFGAFGAWAATRPAAGGAAATLPSLVAAACGVTVLIVLMTASAPSMPGSRTDGPGTEPRGGGTSDRRRFLAVSGAVAVGGTVAAASGRALRGRFSAETSRDAVTLPAARISQPPVPAGVEAQVDGVAPFVTPNRDFYRVDTALVVPQVRAEEWALEVTGMVDRPLRFSYGELLGRDLVEADITMTCVSNPVGGDLVGNARWLGVRTRDLLDEAGVQPDADQLVGRSADGYTCGFPVSAAYDRECLVAVGMNGEPLPLDHGFPARLMTPGIYGYAACTKWLTEIELTTFAAFDQYWVRRGWATEAPIKTMARIDTPGTGQALTAGQIPVGGVAWAQGRGIDAVELRVDDEDFRPAELATALNDDTWRQWRFPWEATPGRHTLTVRAVDGTGQVQTSDRADTVPDGASGWMSRVLLVGEP